MPSSVTGSYSGDAAEFDKSLAGEPWLILAAAVTIYIVLGVLYESFIHPLTILSTLPSAGVGALLALMLFGYDLSVIALIGIVLLMGIVKKNAIMMIDFALEAERGQGLSPRDAIVQASLLRFRPIMMTTLAALFGAMPLAIESGTGSELRNPLGITIIGGLLLSQLLTLYTTPVIYLAMERLKQRFTGTAAVRCAGAAGTTGTLPARRGGVTAMNFSYPFIRRPVGTTLLAIGLFLAGAVAYGFLPVSSMPTVEFPTIRVSASRPGADPSIMAATVAAPLERRLGEIPGVTEITSTQFARQHQHHHPVRSQPQHRRRRARRAGGAQRRADRSAGRPADPAGHAQGQSVGGADPDPGADLQDPAGEQHVRRRRQRHRPAHRPGRRRRRGHRQRRRAAGDAHPGQPGRRRLDGRQPGGRAHRDRQRQFREPARHVRRARSRPHHRHQRAASHACATTRTSW